MISEEKSIGGISGDHLSPQPESADLNTMSMISGKTNHTLVAPIMLPGGPAKKSKENDFDIHVNKKGAKIPKLHFEEDRPNHLSKIPRDKRLFVEDDILSSLTKSTADHEVQPTFAERRIMSSSMEKVVQQKRVSPETHLEISGVSGVVAEE